MFVVGEADPAVVALEGQLRDAQLGADIAALDRLIAGELLVGFSIVSGTHCHTRVWASERGEPRRVVAGHVSLIVDPV